MITGVILARNEERMIVECLQALRPHVDEIILIDMESADRTVELSRPLVNKLLNHPLIPNFDAARNIAIPEASFDWLWFVDADEIIPQTTGRLARQLVADQGHEFEAVHIPFKSYFCGKWIEHCGWWPGYTGPRLLKRGHFRWAERLHGGVEHQGRSVRIPPDPTLGIDHYSYQSVRHYLEKVNNYTSTEAGQLAEKGQVWDWRQAIGDMTHDLWWCYEQNRGNLDGEHGFILSWLSGQYRWLSHAKLLDLAKPKQDSAVSPSIPESLDAVVELMESQLARLRSSRPRLPLDIVFHTPIWDPSGYADEGRAIAKSLAGGTRELALREIHWSDRLCDIQPADKTLLRSLVRAVRPKYTVAITNCIPTLVEPDPEASLNVLRVASETDRIPSFWLDHIARFDEVWAWSRHSAVAFRRSGVPPEKIRIVPSCLDTDVYQPSGAKLSLSEKLQGRFVFLAVFDWQLRKGWDVLLKAYCRTFQPNDGIGLLLKITRGHGHTMETVRAQIDRLLAHHDQSLADRPDIVLWEEQLSQAELAALYRSVHAFVLASRGEAWGRPYMEAMACGLPVIGTAGSGNLDFMNEQNSVLVSATLVDVSDEAVAEIPVFAGQRWFEVDCGALSKAMKTIHEDATLRERIGAKAAVDIAENFNLDQMRSRVYEAIEAAESKFVVTPLPQPAAGQIPVELEGEFFVGHSFSVVNEKLASEFLKDPALAFSARRTAESFPADRVQDRSLDIRPAIDRPLPDGPAVTIRHKFPPNWTRPLRGAWIHIQPWEFGYLPVDWIKPLQEQVDEVWAPSNYIRNVYIRSGVAADKVRVIPWGVDPAVFNPHAPPLFLPTNKSFRFLFVGGTIPRKGFDMLFSAYLSAFGPQDDVCLVVKDLGTDTFYQHDHFREQIQKARSDPRHPEIVYIDRHLSEGQLASLYTACDCLVAPYRGEGFGLPILEAMACGLAPIVPREGPSDDFTSPVDTLYLPTEIVETSHPWKLCGPPLALQVHPQHLAQLMRFAFQNRDTVRTMGAAGSDRVRRDFTWTNTARMMREWIEALAKATIYASGRSSLGRLELPEGTPIVSACLTVGNDESTLAECLARLNEQSIEAIVVASGSTDGSLAIAREYGATIYEVNDADDLENVRKSAILSAKGEWILLIAPNELLVDVEPKNLRQQIHELDTDILALRCAVENGAQLPTRQTRLARKHVILESNDDLTAAISNLNGQVADARFRIVSA